MFPPIAERFYDPSDADEAEQDKMGRGAEGKVLLHKICRRVGYPHPMTYFSEVYIKDGLGEMGIRTSCTVIVQDKKGDKWSVLLDLILRWKLFAIKVWWGYTFTTGNMRMISHPGSYLSRSSRGWWRVRKDGGKLDEYKR